MTLVEQAIELAEQFPLPPHPNKRRGRTFNRIRSIAFHLSRLTEGRSFILPQEVLAAHLSISQKTAGDAINGLRQEKVVRRTRKANFLTGRAARYRFTEKLPTVRQPIKAETNPRIAID